jgi:proteic killer suppression protein
MVLRFWYQGAISQLREGEMDVEFADDQLDRLETDASFSAGWESGIVKGFRKVIQVIRAAPDERDFYALKSLHFEKLEGRDRQRSFRLNKKWRLIVELVGEAPNKKVRVLGIEDYH